LNELSRAAGIDKSQMSRVVSGLAARRLVLRSIDAADGRGVKLTLTRAGRALYQGLIRAAAERNDAFLDCLSAKERAAFDAALDKLAARAREFIGREGAGR
jgi:DNA-binding MarR family transcriptional regulator